MLERKRSITPHTLGLVLAAGLALAGLLLATTTCESLSAETPALTSTAAQTTAPLEADSAQVFFGSWEGTYTTLEVRDENGPVTDPPVPLNTPLEMHLVLHALSEASGDCGTVTVAGYPGGRVTELSVEGQVLHVSIISEEEGLEDLRSEMTLTLEGDTLTGQDQANLEVPEGWYVTSGTVYLTRTASTATAGVQAAGDGDTVESTEASSTGPSLEYMGIGPEPTTGAYLSLLLEPEDNGQTFEIHTGDYVVVALPIEDLIPDWVDPDPSEIDVLYVHVYPLGIEAACRAVATGTAQLRVRWRDSGAIIVSSWSATLSITE